MVRPGHSLDDGANPTRRSKRNRDDPVIQGKGVHWSSPAVTHGVEPRTAVSARLAHYRVSRRKSHTRTGSSRSGLAAGTGFMSQCRHRGSGPGGGVQRPPSYTRWTPVDNTEIGLGGRERHVVVHCRLAEVLVASAPTCLVGMLPLNAALTSRLPPRSLIRQSPTGAPRRRRHLVASTRRDDH